MSKYHIVPEDKTNCIFYEGKLNNKYNFSLILFLKSVNNADLANSTYTMSLKDLRLNSWQKKIVHISQYLLRFQDTFTLIDIVAV